MLKTRLIPVLLLKNGRMVKGKQFKDFRDTGDPVSAARIYNAQKADELAFLDIDATTEGRGTFLHVIERVSEECFMPFTVGGGVQTIEAIREVLKAGADKVLVNTAVVENPTFLARAADIFGRQCMVVGVDVRRKDDGYEVWTHSGKTQTRVDLAQHLENVQKLGAGEIFINSIDEDGMMNGYDKRLLHLVRSLCSIPVIACGGAGHFQHLAEAIEECGVDAVACASLFHFGDNNPIRARAFLKNRNIPVKNI